LRKATFKNRGYVVIGVFSIAWLVAMLLFSCPTPKSVYGADVPNAPSLSMPVEHVNYTITEVDGVLWAKIDGNYPIYNSGYDVLPMVYPTPPETTNISVRFNGALVSWSNYTELFPEALHHTGIGDWSMIYAVLDDVPSFFILEIHYEHPVQVINGSYMFLYDLNIRDYLSAPANKSTAYFNVKMDVNFTDLKVQTVALDASLHPINYTVTEGYPLDVSVQMVSEYDKPLLGDLLFSFSAPDLEQVGNQQVPWLLYSVVGVVVTLLVTLLGYFLYRFSKKNDDAE
jgi:hypothetical protein